MGWSQADGLVPAASAAFDILSNVRLEFKKFSLPSQKKIMSKSVSADLLVGMNLAMGVSDPSLVSQIRFYYIMPREFSHI